MQLKLFHGKCAFTETLFHYRLLLRSDRADVLIELFEQFRGDIIAESAEVDKHFVEEFFVIAADHVHGQIILHAVFVGDEEKIGRAHV